MWEAKGYCGAGNVADLIDSQQGRPAIIAGNGRHVFEEVLRVSDSSEYRDALSFAANDVGVYLPRVDYMVSMHSLKLEHWAALRQARSNTTKPRDFEIHDGGIFGERPWYQWKDLTPLMGLSGYFAMQIAYLMGCEPIMLCGCPGDATPRFWELECNNPGYVSSQRDLKAQLDARPKFKSSVRSMSGWTREYFGS